MQIMAELPASGIQVGGLSYLPPGARQPALRDVSFCLRRGEFIAVLGHNGSGKSTLARHLNGLIRPQVGRVVVDGMDTAIAEVLPAIRRRVGLIFQNPDHQIVGASVIEDVLWGMPAGVAMDEAHGQAMEALAAVGLAEYAGQATWRLSGGQKQRLALAGVLARGPGYLICDEPTALLDGRSRQEVGDLLRGCWQQGLGLFWITHRLEEAIAADRVLLLSAGAVVAAGTPREIIEARKDVAAGLPAPVMLARRLRAAGMEIEDLPESPEALATSIAAHLAAVPSGAVCMDLPVDKAEEQR